MDELRAWAVVAVVAAAVAAVAVAVWWSVAGRDDPAAAVAEAAARYLSAWEQEDWPALGAATTDPSEAPADEAAAMAEALRVGAITAVPDEVVLTEDDAGSLGEVPFRAELVLAGLGTWRYDGELRLRPAGDGWRVVWGPETLHPALRDDLAFERTRSWPERAPILDRDGEVLAGPQPAVVVNVHGARVADTGAVTEALRELTPASDDDIEEALATAAEHPDWRVPVVTVRRPAYDAVRDDLRPVPGLVFDETTRHLPVVDDLAAHVLGRVGPITAEQLEELGDPYLPTDEIGRSGLELVFEERLAGAPSGEVRLVRDGEVVEVVHRFAGASPQPLGTTLDLAVQRAAEEAVAEVEGPVALVALDTRSSEVLAAVSRPLDELDRAFAGRYPPGSTAKIVTTAAILADGTSPEGEVSCPGETTVGGKRFGNAHDLALGTITFAEAFEVSCNTAFVQLAEQLPAGALESAARTFGFGADYPGSPLPVAGGRFPRPEDLAERAAAAIGQGRVEASPVHMASVAAAVATGGWRPPRLLPGEATAPAAEEVPHAATVAELMRRVVTDGTGTAADLPGRQVHGKTGTAEFGSGDPPPTHAWFVGYVDDLAVAVLVEGGGSGGDVAAPVAARLLDLVGPR